MKHIKPAVLPFFLLLAGLILTELLIMNRDLRTRDSLRSGRPWNAFPGTADHGRTSPGSPYL